MNRKSKLLALLLAVVLCAAVFSSVTVFATEEGEEEVPSVPETEYVEPETQAPETEYVEPETQAPETEYVEPETEAPQTEAPAETQEEPVYYEDDSNDYSEDYNVSYEERESNTTSERAETAAVYDAEKDDVSTDTLKKSDWAKIAEQLKNSGGDDGDDFAFIRKNDPNSGNSDDWYIILGIALEAVAAGLIGALVFYLVKRKKAAKAPAAGGKNGKGKTPESKDRSVSQKSPYNARPEAKSRASRATKKQRSKFDTADIAIPKHAQKSGGGKRYKPKH